MMNILVLGKAKTGTTIISQTIFQSLENSRFLMEPKDISYFLSDTQDQLIAKIIFEHWHKTPHLRSALLFNELPLKFDKIVAIMRDPRDELLSRMFYIAYELVRRGGIKLSQLDSWRELIKIKENHPNQVSVLMLLDTLSKVVGGRLNFDMSQTFQYFGFLKNKIPHVYTIRYEDFVDKKFESLENYLGFKLIRDADVGAALARTRRTSSYGNWKYFFLPEDIDIFRSAHESKMSEAGYEDWELVSVDQINPQYGSLYVDRLLLDATIEGR